MGFDDLLGLFRETWEDKNHKYPFIFRSIKKIEGKYSIRKETNPNRIIECTSETNPFIGIYECGKTN